MTIRTSVTEVGVVNVCTCVCVQVERCTDALELFV